LQYTAIMQRIHVEGLLATGVDPEVAENTSFSCYEPLTGFGFPLFDAPNGFNKLNCYLMLWNLAHCSNQGSRFAFNCYRHRV
jgi:hypothetical protein